jgi:hypothetical protein
MRNLGLALATLLAFASFTAGAFAGEPVPLQGGTCGDGRCQPPDDCRSCPQDCGDCCGDGRCAPPEDCRSCPSDCGSCCGDGRCAPPEDCRSCDRDCGRC